MAALSHAQVARARKNESTFLQGLASVGQRPIAEALGVDVSTVSRLKSDGMVERVSHVLALAGLKIVPVDMQCFPPGEIAALLTLAKGRLREIETPDQLAWDDAE